MGFEDRPYYRDRTPGQFNPLMWLMTGSVSLGTWFGIDVRVHASMIVFIVFTLISPRSVGGWQFALISMGALFTIVLLHEFGHCYGSWLVGGQPSQIVMHPLGGLAFADAPRRPWANFVTVLCGPLVNVAICVLAGVILAVMSGWNVMPWNLLRIDLPFVHHLSPASVWVWWVFTISYGMLLFNLWPVFPLDGGQLLQSVLWAKFGYYRATVFATITGMIGAVVFAALGLMWGNFFIIILAFWGFMTCLNMYRELKANGPWAYQDDFEYAAVRTRSSRGASAKKLKAVKRLEQEAVIEQNRIDEILGKVSAQGMHSLTWLEKRALRKATENQRRRDSELARSRRL
jgi:Zn-dependent protease